MKKIKIDKVEPIEYDEDGNLVINLSDTLANDDWIRAARLKKQGKLEELKKMEETAMVRVSEVEEDDADESEKPKEPKPKNKK